MDYAQRKLPLTVFVPAAFVPTDDAAAPATVPLCAVKPVPSQGSGDLRSMAAADALMIVEPGHHRSSGWVPGGRLAQMS